MNAVLDLWIPYVLIGFGLALVSLAMDLVVTVPERLVLAIIVIFGWPIIVLTAAGIWIVENVFGRDE